MADKNAPDHRPRLLVLDMRFPALVWCFDASGIETGDFKIDVNAHLQKYDEALQFAKHIEDILRKCDVDLIAPEDVAKALVLEVTRG